MFGTLGIVWVLIWLMFYNDGAASAQDEIPLFVPKVSYTCTHFYVCFWKILGEFGKWWNILITSQEYFVRCQSWNIFPRTHISWSIHAVYVFCKICFVVCISQNRRYKLLHVHISWNVLWSSLTFRVTDCLIIYCGVLAFCKAFWRKVTEFRYCMSK
jgi:hypothetical protein